MPMHVITIMDLCNKLRKIANGDLEPGMKITCVTGNIQWKASRMDHGRHHGYYDSRRHHALKFAAPLNPGLLTSS